MSEDYDYWRCPDCAPGAACSDCPGWLKALGSAVQIVSTFHEFGASLGAATVSSMVAASIAGTDTRTSQRHPVGC
ncbi:hypothetical protein [Streptomyces sp. NPDC055749]